MKKTVVVMFSLVLIVAMLCGTYIYTQPTRVKTFSAEDSLEKSVEEVEQEARDNEKKLIEGTNTEAAIAPVDENASAEIIEEELTIEHAVELEKMTYGADFDIYAKNGTIYMKRWTPEFDIFTQKQVIDGNRKSAEVRKQYYSLLNDYKDILANLENITGYPHCIYIMASDKGIAKVYSDHYVEYPNWTGTTFD